MFAVAAHQTSETNAASEKCLNNKISHATTMQLKLKRAKKNVKELGLGESLQGLKGSRVAVASDSNSRGKFLFILYVVLTHSKQVACSRDRTIRNENTKKIQENPKEKYMYWKKG